MAASTADKFKKVGAGTVTTLASPGKALAANSINVGSTANYPSDTGFVVAIRQVDTDGGLVAGTYTEWKATVASETALSLDTTPVYGSDQVYTAASTTQVFIPTSAAAQNELIDGLLAEHSQTGAHIYDILTLTDQASIAWNLSLGNIATVTLTDNRTLANPTNLAVGTYVLKVVQDAGGTNTLAYGNCFKWSGSAPVLSTAGNSIDIITFYCDGTTMFGAALKGFA